MKTIIKGSLEPIRLDGVAFDDIEFRACTLLYGGDDLRFGSVGVDIHSDCDIKFDRSALNTLRFLQTLYSLGRRNQIERLFEMIRAPIKDKVLDPNVS